jgi:hypothetical protein
VFYILEGVCPTAINGPLFWSQIIVLHVKMTILVAFYGRYYFLTAVNMRKSRLFRILWLFTGVTVLCLTAIRLWVPNFIENQLRERFERMELYTISFSDIDVSFIDGSYTIKNIEVLEDDSKAPVPLFTADALRFTLPWSNAIDGNFVCNMDLDSAKLTFVRGPSPETSQTGVQSELIRLLKKLSPYPVDNFQANGAVSFHDYHQTPRVEMVVSNIKLTGSNLRNIAEEESLLPGKIFGTGMVGGGIIQLKMKVNPLQNEPIFQMETRLDGIDLGTLADVLKSDHDVQLQHGTLNLTAVTSTEENKIVTDVTRDFKDLQASYWNKSTKVTEEETVSVDGGKAKKPKFIVAGWNVSEPTSEGNQHIEGAILNYKGNLLSLTGETLLGIFTNAVLTPIENSVDRPLGKSNTKVKIAKVGKKEKKNFFQKLFKKKEGKGDVKAQSDETVTASERK